MKVILMLALLMTSQSLLAANECIWTNRIRGFDATSSTTLDIDAGKQDYVMTVSYCYDLKWADRIGFETFSGSRVCWGDNLLILDNFSNHIKDKCRILKIEKKTN